MDPWETLQNKVIPVKWIDRKKQELNISFEKSTIDRAVILQRLNKNQTVVRCRDNVAEKVSEVETLAPKVVMTQIRPIDSGSESVTLVPKVVMAPTLLEEERPIDFGSDSEDDPQKENKKMPQVPKIIKSKNIPERNEKNEKNERDRPEQMYDHDRMAKLIKCDEKVMFSVCIFEKDKKGEAAPGKNDSEAISAKRENDFLVLKDIVNWRKKLCNSYVAPFVLEERTWQSVDHFLLCKQFKTGFIPLEKALLLNAKKNVEDKSFADVVHVETYRAIHAKFMQHSDLQVVLLETKDACLYNRINMKKKERFVELMWLRTVLQNLDDRNSPDLPGSVLDEWVPPQKPKIIKVASYYLTNRNRFATFMDRVFQFSLKEVDDKDNFQLLAHQKVVRAYMNVHSPYRGILLYHSLGNGKSCTSIAIAEGFSKDKRIFVFVPASLDNNYWTEIQTCGDALYRKSSHWEFVSLEGREPELVALLGKQLGISMSMIKARGGAWRVISGKKPNFTELKSSEQDEILIQIKEMIDAKYTSVHYNASNLSGTVAKMTEFVGNPFDHSVVIVDEAHNFVSKIVNHLKKKAKGEPNVFLKLYHYLMDAVDLRIVFLSGTPIVNAPNEIAVLYNMLRGYIYTWKISVKSTTKDDLLALFNKNKFLTYDYVNYSNNLLEITRNPFGFINAKKANGTLKESDYHGVKLDETGKISNDDFIKKLMFILKNVTDPAVTPILSKEKCLEDDPETFQEIFLKKTNDGVTSVLNYDTLQRRILGLTSYYNLVDEKKLPRFEYADESNPKKKVVYHKILVPMSSHQIVAYAKVRNEELIREKRNAKRAAHPNGALFNISSSYRTESRTCCNFAFPLHIEKPAQTLCRLAEAKEDEESDDEPDRQKLRDNLLAKTLNQLETEKKTLLVGSSLASLSPKFVEILKNINEPQHIGLHLLYSNFVTLEGIGIFKMVLEANGYAELKVIHRGQSWELHENWDNEVGKPKFLVYSGQQEPEERDILLKIYNGDLANLPPKIAAKLRIISDSNTNGLLVKVIMISAAGAEGINLKNTRYVHIMEPFWHNIRLDQVVGRARRLNSHLQLPVNLQTVKVFLYLTVMSNTQKTDVAYKELQINDISRLTKDPITTDQYLYETAYLKQIITNQFLNIIKSTAVDCKLYVKGHNQNDEFLCYGHYEQKDFNDFQSHPKLKEDLANYQ